MQIKNFGGSQRNLIKAPREEGDFFERMMARIGRSWNPERLEHISQLGFRGRVFFLPFVVSQGQARSRIYYRLRLRGLAPAGGPVPSPFVWTGAAPTSLGFVL
jgi:hypothetical protein